MKNPRTRSLGRAGLFISSLFLVLVFPSSVLVGEFMRDIEEALPGLIFWLLVFAISYVMAYCRGDVEKGNTWGRYLRYLLIAPCIGILSGATGAAISYHRWGSIRENIIRYVRNPEDRQELIGLSGRELRPLIGSYVGGSRDEESGGWVYDYGCEPENLLITFDKHDRVRTVTTMVEMKRSNEPPQPKPGKNDTEAESPSKKKQVGIYVQPLGESLPEPSVTLIQTALKSFYGVTVSALPRVDLPDEAYYPPRKRYRAGKLLRFLEKKLPADGHRVLGLTAVDISTTKGKYPDWGILGLATVDGRACVISSFRAKKGAKNASHTRERLAKVAIHEIGHAFGLRHCPTVGCIMEDAQGKVSTTDREYDICGKCRDKLKARGHLLPANPKIPWGKRSE